jgi:hypothetical protein
LLVNFATLGIQASQVVEQDRVSQIEEALFTLSQRRFNGNVTEQIVGASCERLESHFGGSQFDRLFPGADLKRSCSLSCSRRTP